MGLSAVIVVTGFSVGSAQASFVDAPFSRIDGDHRYGDDFDHKSYVGRSSNDDEDNDEWQRHGEREYESHSDSTDSHKHHDWDDDEDDDHKEHCEGSSFCWTLTKETHSEHTESHHHSDNHHDDEEEPCDDDTHHYPEDVGQVPLPGAAMLFGSGLAVIAASRRRKSKMRTTAPSEELDVKKGPQLSA